ncbi:PIH1 domain-containing protein 1-like [Venturia canescens]|uniref:PIH1 domain-containing protein 1-like n=1 Tax=Venturia canescens TaxID=32260 RepID=UPI001C9D566D|nr:PIH1 domain-containing protein 1-like [Venturia canescens]
MSNKTLLEVDDSILRNNLLLTEKKSEEQEFDDLLRKFEKPEPPSLTFCPLPGACIKCKTDTGEKVFLNICHTTKIPPPEDLSEEQLFNVIEKEETSWSIPMSIGHERFEKNKEGIKCLTYDIALNTKHFEKCQSQKAMWTFTIVTIISGVSEKHNRNIQSEFKILKNRKVMGKLHDHRVQKREAKKPVMTKPLIEEIQNTSGLKKIQAEIPEKENMNSNDPQYILLRKPKDGKVEQLIGYFKLPSRLRIKDIRVDVFEDRIIVEAPRTNYLVDVFVPYTLDQEKVTAAMDQNINVLRLIISVM